MLDSQLSIGHFTCVKSFDGLTLFSRSIPNSIQIPYRIVETLNTILTIGDKFGLRLHSIDSHELKIVWKIYHANITLILIEESSAHSEQVSFRKLDLLFDALVFMYGLEDLLNIQNVEKFKLDIKIAYPLIDAILRGEHFDLFGGYLANLFDLVIVNDVRRYQALLNSTCQSISSYACLFLNGKIVAATAAWLELKPVESYLISLLCLSLDSPNCRDIPVYLPHKNPHQPLRLLTYSLTCDNLTLCFICSEKPKVDLIESMIYKIWHPQYKELLELRDLYPRNLPSNISTDQNMISFLLINKVTNCCTASLLPNEKVNFNLSKVNLKAKYDLLKKCYLLISSLYFNKSDVKRNNDESNLKKTDVLEAYIEMSGFKCFALNDIVFEFYALYKKDIPTYALRGVTKTCYAILTKLH